MRQVAILDFNTVKIHPKWKFWKPTPPTLNDFVSLCIEHDVNGVVHQFVNIWEAGRLTLKFIIKFWESPPHTWLKAIQKKYGKMLHLFDEDDQGVLQCEHLFSPTKYMTTTIFDLDAGHLATWQAIKNQNVAIATQVQGLAKSEHGAWDGMHVAKKLAKLDIRSCVEEYTRCDQSRRHIKIGFHKSMMRSFCVKWWYINASKMNFICVPNGFMQVNNEPVLDTHQGYHTPSPDGRTSH